MNAHVIVADVCEGREDATITYLPRKNLVLINLLQGAPAARADDAKTEAMLVLEALRAEGMPAHLSQFSETIAVSF